MATGTGTFTYNVTAAPGAGASGSGTFSYDVTAPGSGASGFGTFSYNVTTPVGPAGLWLRTELTTAVRPRLFRRTGAATAVELVPTVSGGGGGGGGGGTPPALCFIYPGDQGGGEAALQLKYAPPAGAVYVDPAAAPRAARAPSSPVQTYAGQREDCRRRDDRHRHRRQEYVLHEGVAMPIDGVGYTAAQTYAGVTINKANVTVQPYPGATIVNDGTSVQTGWTSSNGVWSKPLVITADRGATDTYGKLDNDARGIGWLWVRSQKWHDLVVAAGSTEQQAQMFPLASWPEQVWINGVRQKQVATLAEVVPGTATFYIEGHTAGTNGILWTSERYHLGTNPTGKEVRVANLCTGYASGATGVTFRGIKMRRFAGSVQMGGVAKCRGTNTRWENCVVEDCMIGFDSISDGARFVQCEGWRCGGCRPRPPPPTA